MPWYPFFLWPPQASHFLQINHHSAHSAPLLELPLSLPCVIFGHLLCAMYLTFKKCSFVPLCYNMWQFTLVFTTRAQCPRGLGVNSRTTGSWVTWDKSPPLSEFHLLA